MAELCVDQIGQRRPVGFVADVPGLQPSQLGVGRAGARLRHLGQAQVDRVGEDRGQQLDGLPVVAHGKGLEAEHRLQFDQVLAPGLLPLPVFVPAFDADLELVGDQFQQGRKRRLIDAQDDTRKAQVTELHGEAQPVGRAAPLPDDGEVGFAERVVTDQLILGVRQRQQAFALGGGQD